MAKTSKEMYIALNLASKGMTAYAIEQKFKKEGKMTLTRMAICKRPEYKEILIERRKEENPMRDAVEQIIDILADELNADVNTMTHEERNMLGYMDELEKFAYDNGT